MRKHTSDIFFPVGEKNNFDRAHKFNSEDGKHILSGSTGKGSFSRAES